MPDEYLTLLTIALGSVYVYLRTSADITKVLGALTGVICLIWGLALAPMLVQLLIVLLLLWPDQLYKPYAAPLLVKLSSRLVNR